MWANPILFIFCSTICSLFVIISAIFPDVRWVKGFHSEYFVYISYFISGYIIVHCLKYLKYARCVSLILSLGFLFLGTINDIYKLTDSPFDFLCL